MNIVVEMLVRKAKKLYPDKKCVQMRNEAQARYKELSAENQGIPKAMKMHTDMCIFPAIAAYDTFIAHGIEKSDAVNIISDFFSGLSRKGFAMFSVWLHMFGNYHGYPASFVKNSQRDFSPKAGFQYRLPDKPDPAIAKFDILKCPYNEMCKKYNCLELNRAFCDSDDAKYGHLHPNLLWRRTGTLGKGADCCDFLIADTSRCQEKI